MVQTFVKKPIPVDAVRFIADDAVSFSEIRLFVGERESNTKNPDGSEHKICNFQAAGTYVFWDEPDIRAEVWDKLHSIWVGVKDGQWIMKGSEGEFYPCVDDGTGTAPLNYARL